MREKCRVGKFSDEQIAEAPAAGVGFGRPYRDPKPKLLSSAERREQDLLARLERSHPCFREHGHVNVRQVRGVAGWPVAGRWVASLRTRHCRGQLPDSVVEAAEAMGITWNINRHRSRQLKSASDD